MNTLKWLYDVDDTLKPFPSGTLQQYILKQIERLESGNFDQNDCLYRIASAADLIGVGEQITDSNRASILAWIEGFKLAQTLPPKGWDAIEAGHEI